MPVAEYQLTELKRAYQILGVPLSASALLIKRTYRRMAKRWHPDLYPSGTSAHLEATRMMKLVNEAYAAIEHAPLRYHIESNPQNQVRNSQIGRSSKDKPTRTSSVTNHNTDRLEFWVRFVCGASFGVLIGLHFVIELFEHPAFFVLGAAGAILGFGFAAARYGDNFWYSILRRWWLWS